MKAIIQRVTAAKVTVGEELVSSIGRGICVLVGISRDDTQKDVEFMVRKILNLRVFEDDAGKSWSKCVKDQGLEVLCVSQFTLSCIMKGNKPDFHDAMTAEQSQILYASFLDQMKAAYDADKIKDGRFQTHMQVHIQNDGPVTIPLESTAFTKHQQQTKGKAKEQAKPAAKSSADAAESTGEPAAAGES